MHMSNSLKGNFFTNSIIKDLAKLQEEFRTDVSRHGAYNTITDAMDLIINLPEYSTTEIEMMEVELVQQEERIIELEDSLIDTDAIIDSIEELYSLNVEQLKHRARQYNIATSGTKAELVRRLFEDARVRGSIGW